ncbi:MAG: RNA 3'-phosphate cyclase [Betaproteobacteria bacterium]|nr:MAG: RNA 3'-phosphate cyclase [Betaproteobacteria bacterium]
MTQLQIDGAHGEGGGQLVRTAVALAALTGKSIRIENIRARRDKPGLAAQHLTAVRAVATLCDADVSGLELRSQQIEFRPQALRGGEFCFDVGTAGSITLVLQAVLPALIAGREPAHVVVTGGTDVRWSPPVDYLREVMLPLIERMGPEVRLEVTRRGYYPRGGGEVAVSISPELLQPLQMADSGALQSLHARVHVSNLPLHIAERMRDSMTARLESVVEQAVEVEMLSFDREAAVGPGGAVVAWARTEHTVLGAGRVAERGIRAETLGDAVGRGLATDLAAGVTLDLHASDQLLVYFALARGPSVFTTHRLSSHAQTAMWLIEQFLPVQFEVRDTDELVTVTVQRQ